MKKIIIEFILAACLVAFIEGSIMKISRLTKENERLENNIEYYKSYGDENVVLRLTVDELKHSRDTLIEKVDSLRRELKIKPKEVQTIIYNETVLRDTLRDTIGMERNFEKVFMPNSETTIVVVREDTSLTVIPDIRNEQTVFVTTEVKHKYKGFFRRLAHFNFKKTKVNKYEIVNSNDLIQTGETMVINVE